MYILITIKHRNNRSGLEVHKIPELIIHTILFGDVSLEFNSNQWRIHDFPDGRAPTQTFLSKELVLHMSSPALKFKIHVLSIPATSP